MLNAYTKSRQLSAVLDNAFDIDETLKMNAIDELVFKMPFDDPKNEFCAAYCLVQVEDSEGLSQFYVIVDEEPVIEEVSYFVYTCESVISLLLNSQIRSFTAFGGLGFYTREVLEGILSYQRERNFILDKCDFSRQFEYGFEKESCLSALFSIPRAFSDQYIWQVDSNTSFPYKISLLNLDTSGNPDLYVRCGYNRLRLSGHTDYRNVCTELYAYGMGEGVNQLQAGPFLASSENIRKYGIIERNWIDRRYNSVETLSAAAQVLVDEISNPRTEWSVDVVVFDKKPYIGQIVYIEEIGLKTYITEMKIRHDEKVSYEVTIANRTKDVATDIANIADRQRIETSYSQGATNIYSGIVADNADANNPLPIDLYFTSDMIFINKVLLKIRMGSFRAYSATTETAGESISTSSAGGGSQSTSSAGGASQTTSSGGGGTSSSTSGGGGTSTSTGGGGGTSQTLTLSNALTNTATEYTQYPQTGTTESHRHSVAVDVNHKHGFGHSHSFSLDDHTHGFSVGAHTHNFSVSAHTHTVSVGSHTHTVQFSAHTHTVQIPGHKHDIKAGIHFFGNPTTMRIVVGGVQKQVIVGTDAEIDVLPYLLDARGEVPRDTYSTILIYPNDIAHIQATYNVINYIQSRGGNRY